MSETRYRSLDGLRALAISLVLVSHLRGSRHAPQYPEWWWHVGDLGNLGVRIFFVISGFIITHLLLKEWDRTSSLNINAFYVRRAFRILPPVLIFLGIIAVGMCTGLWTVPWRQWWLCLVFLGNYTGGHGTWTLGHLWSLSVEEQFYLLWPICLAWTLRRSRNLLVLPLSAVVVAPLVRLLGAEVIIHDPTGFPENMDALAMGVLAAIVRWSPNFRRVRIYAQSLPAIVYAVLMVALNFEPMPVTVKVVFCYPLLHLCVAGLILSLLEHSEGLLARLLSIAPLVWVGTISYSLYLFQQPIFNRPPIESLPYFPVSILLAVGLAAGSYYTIELPVRRLRDRLLVRSVRD